MSNEAIIRKRIQKKYNDSNMQMHSMRFFQDFSEGFSYYLGEKNKKKSFITVEPEDSQLYRILKSKYSVNLSYDIEQILGKATYSLMNYGVAYLYATPIFEIVENKDGEKSKFIKSLEIGELRGILTHRNKSAIEFYAKVYSGNIKKVTLEKDNFVILDLKELGYSKRYFHNIAYQLDKYDATADTLNLLNIEGYSFTEHLKHNTIKELKLTKSIGWTFMNEGLSDSYILYRRIELNKLRILMINYVIEKLNLLVSNVLSQDSGRIIANLRTHNYDEWWEAYRDGKLTVSELSKLVL